MPVRPVLSRLLPALVLLPVFGCDGYGKKVAAGDVEVYYKGGATEAEARKLLDYLTAKAPAAPGQPRSYQVVHRGEVVVVRMAVREEKLHDEALLTAMAEDAKRLSAEVFENRPVDLELCDEHLKTRQTVSWGSEGYGRKVADDRFEVYYTGGATEDEARKLLAKLARDLPARAERGAVQLLRRPDERLVIRYVLPPEKIDDAKTADTLRKLAREVSAELFDNQPVDVELCDTMLRTQKTLRWGET
jgi:hypothetical protein